MFERISKYCLEIIFEISEYINRFSNDLEDFQTDQFKNSDAKEVLKEESVRVKLFNKLQNNLKKRVVKSNRRKYLNYYIIQLSFIDNLMKTLHK